MVGEFQKVQAWVITLSNLKWLKFLDLTSMIPDNFFFPWADDRHIMMHKASFETNYL